MKQNKTFFRHVCLKFSFVKSTVPEHSIKKHMLMEFYHFQKIDSRTGLP